MAEYFSFGYLRMSPKFVLNAPFYNWIEHTNKCQESLESNSAPFDFPNHVIIGKYKNKAQFWFYPGHKYLILVHVQASHYAIFCLKLTILKTNIMQTILYYLL